MTITLFEFSQTRSVRVRWTLLELGLPFESKEGAQLFGSPELCAVHPMGKIPAILDGGRPLFESAAICNWLADSHPESGLIPPAGSWDRALHDQWVCFTLAELEANLWHTARNLFVLPEEERVTAAFEQNEREAKKALAVFDAHLAGREWLVGDRFGLTDIIAGYAICWASWLRMTAALPHVDAYAGRLQALPKCPYRNPVPESEVAA